jgi:VCBS repeat-containing protein
MDMVEGTGGNCTDKAANSTGPLFQLLDADLESVASLINLQPFLTSISPSTGTADAAFTLTVNGTNFVSGATVLWNGTPLPTTFVNSTQLTAAVPAGDLATSGTFPVKVANPSPGGATSNALSFTVASVSTSIAISSLSNASLTLVSGGAAQTITVSLSRSSNYIGGITLATSTLPSGVTANITQPGIGNSGSIALQAASNATQVSNQTITVTASGSGVSSATATFSLTVNPAPAFSLAVSPASTSVTAGQSATYTLSVTPVGGFNQQVALSCTGAPSEATCSVSPSSVTLDGAGVAKPTVMVSTTAASLATRGRRLVPPRTAPDVPWGAWPLLLAVLSSFASWRGRRVRFRLAGLAAAMFLILGWAACGGGGSSTTTTNSGTPTGTYKLTLTGTYSGSSGNMTQTTTASLTVN